MDLTQKEADFIANIKRWREDLKPLKFDEIFKNGAHNVAFISVDMINGFCHEGTLSSPRCGAIASKLVQTFKIAHDDFCLKNFVLIEDSHDENCAEFSDFPPHAIKGGKEAETIDELKNLDFYKEMKIFKKNSLSSAFCKGFNDFIAQNPQINTFVIFGDCTDLCVYQLVSHLKLQANEHDIKRRVIVPDALVQTYDSPQHDGDLYHLIFLHHMSIGLGAKVVKDIV